MPDYLRPPRPVGISILSVLHFLGGAALAVLAGVLPMMAARKPEIAETLATIGMPLPLLIAGILFLASLAIGSAVGMWIGAKWGWYLGSFYYVYSVIRNLLAIVSVYLLVGQLKPEELADAHRGPEYHYLKFSIRAVIHTLIYVYFFKRNVLEYFGLTQISVLKVVVIELVICSSIAIAFSFLGAMSS